MSIGFYQTICAGCNKLVPKEPGVCLICGHILYKNVVPLVPTQDPAQDSNQEQPELQVA